MPLGQRIGHIARSGSRVDEGGGIGVEPRLVLSESYFGGMFWLRRKKFVGSYLRLSSTSRSYFSVP